MPAIAAGHPEVAEVCRQTLLGGGNAVDAACAGALAACVCEPVLASLGGGGLAVVATPGGEVYMIDFWVCHGSHQNQPSGERVLLNWSGGVKQPFLVGPQAAGLWRLPQGLGCLSDHFGSLPLSDLTEPSIRLAERGVQLNSSQAEWMRLLHQVHVHHPSSSLSGSAPKEGQRFSWPEQAEDLRLLSEQGPEAFGPGGQFWYRAAETLGEEAISALSKIEAPVYPHALSAVTAGGWELYMCSQPSISSSQIGEVLGSIDKADDYRSLARALAPEVYSPHPSTTAISVASEGLMVAVVISNGSGGGVFVGGTQLNNVAGEVELRQSGRGMPPGMLPTRMCPLFAQGERGWVSLGSGGSERITTATLHTLYGVIFERLSLEGAIATPRIYMADELQAEPAAPAARYLSGPVNTWPALDPYFGGVNAVGLLDEKQCACSDPRRQGSALLI